MKSDRSGLAPSSGPLYLLQTRFVALADAGSIPAISSYRLVSFCFIRSQAITSSLATLAESVATTIRRQRGRAEQRTTLLRIPDSGIALR